MKRLFAIRKPNGRVVKSAFFATKPEAKVARDAFNKTQGEGHHVTCGPDHRRYVL